MEKQKSVESGVDLIAAERARQVSAEGWTAEHDDGHTHGELAAAAAAYAWPYAPALWPWGDGFKPTSRERDLVRAGALIAAEIDRLRRAKLHVA
jgi:hypothetical protein